MGNSWDFRVIQWDIHGIYPLVMTNSSPWYRWTIEIDGLPNLKMGGSFPGELLNSQRVSMRQFSQSIAGICWNIPTLSISIPIIPNFLEGDMSDMF